MATTLNASANPRCRLCLLADNAVRNIRETTYVSADFQNMQLTELIMACASLQVSTDDLLPQHVCLKCLENANISFRFRQQCENSEKILIAELEQEKTVEQSDFFRLDTTEGSELEDTLSPITEPTADSEPKSSTPTKSHQCINCKQAFRTRKKLNEHLKTHTDFQCKQCGAHFANISNLRKHAHWHTISKMPKHPKPLIPAQQRTCDICSKEFKYRASMLKHKRKHGAPMYACSHCDEKPTTPMQLARHMEDTHSHLKTVVCSQCGKTFFKEANLRLHMAVHSGIKRHMCEICGLSFALAGNLTAHRRLHTGSKPYTCSNCGRGFTQQAALRSHEAGHSNQKNHVCSECGAAFSRAGALRNHQKRHLPARPFPCSMCSKAFTFSSERKRHMMIHTGEKNHQCDTCGRRFNRSTNLFVHRRIHTGETPHMCTVCGKGFKQAHCLRTHMATHLRTESIN